MKLAAALCVLLLAPAAPVLAQTWPTTPQPGYGGPAAIAEQHRFEMERLRTRAAERDALARLRRLETRLTLQELQSRRAPPQGATTAPYVLPSDPQRARRETEAARRDPQVGSVSEIDAWLDRRPD